MNNLKIVTYNLRQPWAGDGTNSFFARFGLIIKKIYDELPDIICFQEAIDSNMALLKRHLSEKYTVVFNQRCTGLTGEGLAFALKKDRISLYGLDLFWLSDNIYEEASRFEGQSIHPRICQDILCKDELTGKCFRLYNLHLEESSEEVRLKQIKVVDKKISEDKFKGSLPYFVLGDFNSTPSASVFDFCISSSADKMIDLTSQINNTFHDYGRRDQPIKIDYIFTDPVTATKSYNVGIWDECVNGIYLSDHYPVVLDIEL